MPRTLGWRRAGWASTGILLIGAVACSGSIDTTSNGELGDPTALDDELAAWTPPPEPDVASIDRRPVLLGQLGGPDAFVITVDEIDGTTSRFESWSYFDARTQIDFVDGEVLWDLEIDDVPDGTYLPLLYNPMEFEMLASVDDTLASLADVELVRVADGDGLDEPGAELWAGEQLVLAFADDQLISVEAMPLAPGEPEVGT